MVALVLDGLVGFPAGLSPTSFHLSPTSGDKGRQKRDKADAMTNKKPLRVSPSSGLRFLYICLPALGVACNPVSAIVSPLWTALSASAFPHLPCNPFICFPNSAVLCPPLPCNPLHLSCSSDCCIVFQSFVSQLWTSQNSSCRVFRF